MISAQKYEVGVLGDMTPENKKGLSYIFSQKIQDRILLPGIPGS